MFNPIKFCFIHERIRASGDIYLNLEAGTLQRLTRSLRHLQHEPCDLCQSETKGAEQPRLLERQ